MYTAVSRGNTGRRCVQPHSEHQHIPAAALASRAPLPGNQNFSSAGSNRPGRSCWARAGKEGIEGRAHSPFSHCCSHAPGTSLCCDLVYTYISHFSYFSSLPEKNPFLWIPVLRGQMARCHVRVCVWLVASCSTAATCGQRRAEHSPPRCRPSPCIQTIETCIRSLARRRRKGQKKETGTSPHTDRQTAMPCVPFGSDPLFRSAGERRSDHMAEHDPYKNEINTMYKYIYTYIYREHKQSSDPVFPIRVAAFVPLQHRQARFGGIFFFTQATPRLFGSSSRTSQ